VGIYQLIHTKGAGMSYRAIAERARDLGHTAPGESTIEHWGSGTRPIKQLPAKEAVIGLAAALNLEEWVVWQAFLEDLGVVHKQGDALLVSLLPKRVDALDNRPDLLERVIDVVSMTVDQALREEAAKKRPRKTAPAKTPPRKTTPSVKTTGRAMKASVPRQTPAARRRPG